MKLRTSQSVTVCKASLKATSLRLFCCRKDTIYRSTKLFYLSTSYQTICYKKT